MPPGLGPHLEESELERYSMGTLPESHVQPFEEHFLACESCQDRLLEMQAYVNAVRSVSPKLRETSSSWLRPAWIVAALCGLALLIVYARPRSAQVEPEVVLLRASRAADPGSAAPAGRPLRLEIETAELGGASAYRVQVVDAYGRTEAAGHARVDGGKLEFAIDRGLAGGQYFVRLYGDRGRLLREFALKAGPAR